MSEVQIKAQRDLSIAGDVVGRDKITINITRGLDELLTRYDSRVQNFLEYYFGAKDHPAPFGGRASDLAALDAWLDDPAAPPYASLIAPAGRGKSALLAHWVTSRLSGKAVHVVYFPISIRFNTNLETVVFASLAGRMAHVYGEKVTQAVDAQQYRGVFSDYLRRTPAQWRSRAGCAGWTRQGRRLGSRRGFVSNYRARPFARDRCGPTASVGQRRNRLAQSLGMGNAQPRPTHTFGGA